MNISHDEVKPRVFIGSSTEGLEVARLIDQGLSSDADCFLWTDHRIINTGGYIIEGLEHALDVCSYAVIVMTPDVISRSRGKSRLSPRDNLVLELGMFFGRHGRKSVFMIVPERQDFELPSDLDGIVTGKYRTMKLDDGVIYNVTDACVRISEVLRRHRPPHPRVRPTAESFWKGLAERVSIVYGVEHDLHSNPKEHHRMSPRDLGTALLIFGFLNRYFPEKTVEICPARGPKWEGDLTREGDLILVGGFVTNEMYRAYRTALEAPFERNLRLKIGRLCRVEGQRVYHLGLEESAGHFPRADFRALETIPSEFVTRDYGLVTSRKALFYEHYRRVVTIAGVRGNGTRAAAMLLTRPGSQRPELNSLLPPEFSANDSFEMAVEAKTRRDKIVSYGAVELLLNEKRLGVSPGEGAERCELDSPCAGCRFGLLEEPATDAIYPHVPQMRGVKAVIFDLDDTLVDTTRYLIDPLESDAARMMIEAGVSGATHEEVHDTLMQLRMHHPDRIEEELRNRLPQTPPAAIEARRRALATAPSMLSELRMRPEVSNLLARLSATYKLYMVTAGPRDFQRQKIEHLDRQHHIRQYFDEDPVDSIVDSASAETKEERMLALVKGRYKKEAVVVVGNRWDHEIRAGKKLGMRTICVRHGEGSSLVPHEETHDPAHLVVNDIRELYDIL